MEATIIYPHQLFTPKDHPALNKKRPVYLVEEPLLISEFGTHRQKMLLHRLSMQAYKTELESAGYNVTYLTLDNKTTTASSLTILKKVGVTTIHVVDTTDNYLERRIGEFCAKHSVDRITYESPLFILSKDDAINRFKKSGKFMKKFYEQLRKDKKILLDGDKPVGGKWSFDSDNQAKLPKSISLPPDFSFLDNDEITEAKAWLAGINSEQYGASNVWIPYTRAAARAYLKDFLKNRFADFGTYEDAITTMHARVFHSTLSPLINIGLLSPTEVINAAIDYAEKNTVPLNSLEGFVRQILGWREFIRASYETDGSSMRKQNFFNHTRTLPAEFWTGNTGVLPLDTSIATALTYGYTHHIERLMVMGNFMLLSQIEPDNVYKWFMAMYVDAYDWVMVPNVYGMSQFADGGSFATKPYISGASYLKKMSDYPKGDWEDLWTALYWNFIHTHRDFFSKNFRLSMMPKLLEKMGAEKANTHFKLAKEYIQKNNDRV